MCPCCICHNPVARCFVEERTWTPLPLLGWSDTCVRPHYPQMSEMIGLQHRLSAQLQRMAERLDSIENAAGQKRKRDGEG